MKKTICIILLLIFVFKEIKSQDIPINPDIIPHTHLTLEDKVIKSNLVIEGKVVNKSVFFNDSNYIYTSIFIKPLKVFKGSLKDSIIELIIPGGHYPNGGATNWGYTELATGFEGLLFLRINGTAIQSGKSKQSYFYTYGQSVMGYNHVPGYSLAFDGDKYYNDLEKELYQPIEAITHTPRKILGLNSFEIEAAKKQYK